MANDFIRGIKVYIDSQQGSKSMEQLTAKLTQYRSELAKLNAQGESSSKKAERLRDSITRLEKVEQRYNDELRETAAVLKNISGASVNELLLARNRLRSQLKTMKPDTEQYRQMLVTLQRTETQLTLRTKEMNAVNIESRGIFQRLSSALNKYFLVLSTIVTSLIAVIQAGRKSVQAFMDVEEALVRIRKYAGLSSDEVHRLSRELSDISKIDTRTAHLELLELAADAGRLGIKGTDNLKAFVVAADKIRLSLGEDLGADAVTNIGKLANLFGEDKRLGLEEAMLSTASAVTKLAKSSTACEPYLVNFASRLGGIGAVAGISTGDILGLGSALDQNMQKVEMSSTAISTLITKIFQEPAKFARLAGIEVGKFTELVKTDANEALLQFLTMMREKGGFDRLAPMFQDMEMSGKRAVQVLSTLASHVDQVRTAQEIANEAYRENLEVEYEFGLVNNTVQAQLEKRKKQLQALRVELGEELMPLLIHIKTAQSLLVRSLKVTVEFFIKYRTAIIGLTSAIAYYIIASKKAVIAEKLHIAQQKIHILLTRQLSSAFRKLWEVVSKNPYGALLAVMGLVINAVTLLRKRSKELGDTLSSIDSLRRKAVSSVEGEVSRLKALLSVLADENASYEQRITAINELNAISPEYLSGIDAARTSYDEASAAVEKYIRFLQLEAQVEALQSERQDLAGQLDEVTEKIDSPSWWRQRWNDITTTFNFVKNGFISLFSDLKVDDTVVGDIDFMTETMLRTMQDRLNSGVYKDRTELENRISAIDEQMRALLLDINSLNSTTVTFEPPQSVSYLSVEDVKERYEGSGGIIETENDEYERLQDNLDMALARRQISQQEHDLREAHLKSEHFSRLLQIYRSYDSDLRSAVADDEKQREKALTAVHKKTLKAESQYQHSLIDIRESFSKTWEAIRKLSEKDERDEYQRIDDEYNNRLKLARDYYAAIRTYILQNVSDVALASQMLARARQVYDEQVEGLARWRDTGIKEQQLKDLKERNRIVSRYLQPSLQSQYEMELQELDAYHDKGLLSEEEYQKARMKLAYNCWSEGYDRMTKYASDMIASLQQAEIAAVTAKYDVLIREAENNGEDTEKLEIEQANAKLEIEKKFAMSNLLVKLSDITASTAVAIMTGFAQLGPIAGAAAAVMLTTTGLAQYAAALAEYNRISGMSLQSTPSGPAESSIPSMERVVQYASGKYDVIGEDDGRLYRAVPFRGTTTGIVERPALISESGAELIVSAPVLRRLRTHVNYGLVTQAINDARTGRVPQHAEGRYPDMKPSSPAVPQRSDADLLAAIMALTARIDSLPREMRSYVLLDDLNTATELKRRGESPFRRTDRNTSDNGNKD